MASPFDDCFLDPLYGEVRLETAIADLATRPLVQRLRHVRLSNIDSLASPGIANISRYEHALGTAVLAASTIFAQHIEPRLRISFVAAALLHDTAITPFGHLMEEAFSYAELDYAHEKKWALLLEGRSGRELGGPDLQLYLGFQSGLRDWATKFFGSEESSLIESITEGIQGKGRFGAGISGGLDLDNLDNVVRAAFHLGLSVDRKLPLRIVEQLEDVTEDNVVFSNDAFDFIKQWLSWRERVYSRFMLARADFSGKLMLLYSMVEALKKGIMRQENWSFTDNQLLEVLSNSEDQEVTKTIRRWLIGDLWDISDLVWFQGEAPSFSSLIAYMHDISDALSRPCFAYRIKDKRKRKIVFKLNSGRTLSLGENPRQWLLGVGSPLKKPFTIRENRVIIDMARTYFHADLGILDEHSSSLFA